MLSSYVSYKLSPTTLALNKFDYASTGSKWSRTSYFEGSFEHPVCYYSISNGGCPTLSSSYYFWANIDVPLLGLAIKNGIDC